MNYTIIDNSNMSFRFLRITIKMDIFIMSNSMETKNSFFILKNLRHHINMKERILQTSNYFFLFLVIASNGKYRFQNHFEK